MTAFRVSVHIIPRRGLLDPQGKAVGDALHSLGFAAVTDVHVGRHLVIETLEKALQRDRSRTKVVGLSELGLLQLTRKRTRLGIGAALTRECVSCSGTGRTKTHETVAYDALFEVRRVASSFPTGDVTVRTHPDVARALRLALQAAFPVVDPSLVGRLRILDDPEARVDQFDVKAN